MDVVPDFFVRHEEMASLRLMGTVRKWRLSAVRPNRVELLPLFPA
jgi:hypothetical protein